MYYHMTVAGLERDLPICPLNENLSIAGFVIFGDPPSPEGKAFSEYNYTIPSKKVKKNPGVWEDTGVFRLGFGKKRGRKEDLHKERRRLTASVTFLLLRYLSGLNSR